MEVNKNTFIVRATWWADAEPIFPPPPPNTPEKRCSGNFARRSAIHKFACGACGACRLSINQTCAPDASMTAVACVMLWVGLGAKWMGWEGWVRSVVV